MILMCLCLGFAHLFSDLLVPSCYIDSLLLITLYDGIYKNHAMQIQPNIKILNKPS